MPLHPERYLAPSSRNLRRRQGRARRRKLALIAFVILVAAGIAVWAVILPGSKKPTASTSISGRINASTSTSALQAAASSITSTTVAGTNTSTTVSPTAGARTYGAQLSGQNETPPVSTSASGTITLALAADGSSVRYVFSVSDTAGLSVARLHEGKAGATGPIILTIYGGPARTDVFTGVVTTGSFAANVLEGPLKGKTISDLVDLIKAGSIYFNVGSTAHPQGEIRGQLQ